MEYIARPSQTLKILKEYGMDLKKGLGQNYLVDLNFLQKITDAAEIRAGEKVVEIGPGIGSLTQFLLLAGAEVLAIEKDERAAAILCKLLSDFIDSGRLTVKQDDALEYPWAKQEKEEGFKKLVANLPYNIATPLITKLLKELRGWSLMVFMVQKEVGDRLMASPGSKSYGSLSIAVRYYARVEEVAVVPPTVFIPRPKVDSVILRFLPREKAPVVLDDEDFFFNLVRAAFYQRRKTLKNSLINSPFINVTAGEVERALKYLKKDLRVRGEMLSLKEFGLLANYITRSRKH